MATSIDSRNKSEQNKKSSTHYEALQSLSKFIENVKSNLQEQNDEANKCAPGQKRVNHIHNSNKNISHKRAKFEKKRTVVEEVKSKLKILTRNEMEDLVAEKVVELIRSRSDLGGVEQELNQCKEAIHKWENKCNALLKMCQELYLVIKMYIVDSKRDEEKPVPTKIWRSVGLQVSTVRVKKRVSAHIGDDDTQLFQSWKIPQNNLVVFDKKENVPLSPSTTSTWCTSTGKEVVDLISPVKEKGSNVLQSGWPQSALSESFSSSQQKSTPAQTFASNSTPAPSSHQDVGSTQDPVLTSTCTPSLSGKNKKTVAFQEEDVRDKIPSESNEFVSNDFIPTIISYEQAFNKEFTSKSVGSFSKKKSAKNQEQNSPRKADFTNTDLIPTLSSNEQASTKVLTSKSDISLSKIKPSLNQEPAIAPKVDGEYIDSIPTTIISNGQACTEGSNPKCLTSLFKKKSAKKEARDAASNDDLVPVDIPSHQQGTSESSPAILDLASNLSQDFSIESTIDNSEKPTSKKSLGTRKTLYYAVKSSPSEPSVPVAIKDTTSQVAFDSLEKSVSSEKGSLPKKLKRGISSTFVRKSPIKTRSGKKKEQNSKNSTACAQSAEQNLSSHSPNKSSSNIEVMQPLTGNWQPLSRSLTSQTSIAKSPQASVEISENHQATSPDFNGQRNPVAVLATSQNLNISELKNPPPKPLLTLAKQGQGIVVSWNLDFSLNHHALPQLYQIFSREQIVGQALTNTSPWQKVGDFSALPLPMACSLSQFTPGRNYYFVVRAQDVHGRIGPFSDISFIQL